MWQRCRQAPFLSLALVGACAHEVARDPIPPEIAWKAHVAPRHIGFGAPPLIEVRGIAAEASTGYTKVSLPDQDPHKVACALDPPYGDHFAVCQSKAWPSQKESLREAAGCSVIRLPCRPAEDAGPEHSNEAQP